MENLKVGSNGIFQKLFEFFNIVIFILNNQYSNINVV